MCRPFALPAGVPRPRYTVHMETGKVTERDKDYMRRLAKFEEEGRREWMTFLESLSLDERVRRSFERTHRGKPYGRREPEDLQELYDRARKLGLYRG